MTDEAMLREAAAIIQDIALCVSDADDTRPLLDELPPSLSDRIAAFLDGHGRALSAPAPESSEAGVSAGLDDLTELLRRVDAADEPPEWDAAVSHLLGRVRLLVLEAAALARSQEPTP